MTSHSSHQYYHCSDFNPHEREARDLLSQTVTAAMIYFNPHEREARDALTAFIRFSA